MLDFMYITKSPETARIAEEAGVDRIFVDLEKRGKEMRQKGMNTVKSDHTVADVRAVRRVLTRASLLVRVNPIYEDSETEIRSVIDAGADIVMLPFFKTKDETDRFLACCGGRVKTMLLVETPEAAEHLDAILSGGGVDLVHVGINDLHLCLKKKFMFELLTDGTVESICRVCGAHGVPYGFGGVARLGGGLLPAEYVLAEHYRLGSSAVILSRSFCDASLCADTDEFARVFQNGVRELRAYEEELQRQSADFFVQRRREMAQIVRRITEEIE